MKKFELSNEVFLYFTNERKIGLYIEKEGRHNYSFLINDDVEANIVSTLLRENVSVPNMRTNVYGTVREMMEWLEYPVTELLEFVQFDSVLDLLNYRFSKYNDNLKIERAPMGDAYYLILDTQVIASYSYKTKQKEIHSKRHGVDTDEYLNSIVHVNLFFDFCDQYLGGK